MRKRRFAGLPGSELVQPVRGDSRGIVQPLKRLNNDKDATVWPDEKVKPSHDRLPVGSFAFRTGWLPLLVLPPSVVGLRNHMPAWAFMWTLALSIYAACKWQTWWTARAVVSHGAGHSFIWRSFVYLAAWPGMDAASFLKNDLLKNDLLKNDRLRNDEQRNDEQRNDQLGNDRRVRKPRASDWILAATKTAMGGMLLWVAARMLPADLPLLRGWTGMLGAVLLLHFGAFHLAALLWQSRGIDACPLMNTPLASRSLSEFWGRRWNAGFHQLAHDLVFVPLRRKSGVSAAGFLVFIVSGLVHDLVISLPARGGYGLPTLYFALQGSGVALERSRLGRQLGLRGGVRGWLFMSAVTAAPAFWLFHRPFVCRVILPFMEVIHAL